MIPLKVSFGTILALLPFLLQTSATTIMSPRCEGGWLHIKTDNEAGFKVCDYAAL